jgi:hypothetical protein
MKRAGLFRGWGQKASASGLAAAEQALTDQHGADHPV